MYQLYLVKSGNKQICFYNLPCSKVSQHIVLDFAPTNQIGTMLKYFRSGSNLKYLNVPNPELDNFFLSYQIKKPVIQATTHQKTGFVLILANIFQTVVVVCFMAQI